MPARPVDSSSAYIGESIGILGLGYVGLQLALLFAESGRTVVGVDVDQQRVRTIAKRRSPFGHIPSKRVASAITSRRLIATVDARLLSTVSSVLICVPTPLTRRREPDLAYVVSAAGRVAQHCQPGVLVVLESTTYPGTTREVLLPILESRGWKLGNEFFLAYSPEREDPNNSHYNTRNTPKLVAGADQASLTRAMDLYGSVIDTLVPVLSCEIAEAAKLLENVFRAVNVALVNELKMVLDKMGIDVWDTIAAARTKPFGFMPFYPGPGLGGHCTPIDPFYLSWKAREFDAPTRFIELAGEINTQMPNYVFQRVQHALNTRGSSIQGARILVLGIAYKKGVDDFRESPALKLMDLLEEAGARVSYHDPLIPRFQGISDLPRLRPRRSVPLSARLLRARDLVLLATDHEAVDYEKVRMHSKLIVDTRRVWQPDNRKIFGA